MPERLAPGSTGTAALGGEAEHRADARLPIVGPAFSACVLLLGAWDAVAGGSQTRDSLLLRLALVLLGIPGYAWQGAPHLALPRWMMVYLTHSLALAVNAVSLAYGLTQAIPVLMITMLVTGLVETRPGHCTAILLPPMLVYGIAGALALPNKVWLASLAACGIAVAIAALIAAANGNLREAHRRREQQLLHACRFDSLSGAMSRAYLTELGMRDLSLARRHARPLAVAMIDIDHFKRVNDTHGHATGDAVIRALADTCRNSLRHADYVGRIGGEEFVCVMPETGAAEAMACAERIRTNVERLRVAGALGPVCATVSIGVAVLCSQDGWDTLLREADAALYRAKNGGRNRTILADRKPCRACA